MLKHSLWEASALSPSPLKESSDSGLHSPHPCVGGFVHFWWAFKYICFGGREKVKLQ